MVNAGMLLTEECTKNAMSIRHSLRDSKYLTDFYFLERFSDIAIRFVEMDGIVRVMVEIGEETTHRDLRDAVSTILKCRNDVQDLQADKIAYRLYRNIQHPANREELLELFSYLQEHGVSYASLADRFNKSIAGLLERYSEIRQKDRFSTEEMIKMNSSLTSAENLLTALGVNDIDLSAALELIADGKPPFEKGYPVSRWKMIEVLRTWRKGEAHQNVKRVLKKARSLKKET